jgi:predicted rRNA pseudouridine synthase
MIPALIKPIRELLEFGIINFDKPAEYTSFDVANLIKKRLGLRKTSHFGTLDPMVTGVLPMALNRACKLTGYFIGEDKEYIGTMILHQDASLEKIRSAIKEKFTGKIIQLPPVKSRVKRQEREREIKKFELLEKKDRVVSFHVECQGGTYIRKIVHDLGEYMGIGANMKRLRRIRAGIFKEGSSVTLKDFELAVEQFKAGKEESLRKFVMPAEEAITKAYTIIQIKEKPVEKILHGRPVYYEDLKEKQNFTSGQLIGVFCKDRFIGMFKTISHKEILAKPEFVLQPI